MSLLEHAKRELALINTDGDEMQNAMDRYILHMIDEFSKEGHSGFSASYAISFLERLLRFKPLTPLTGEDDEWNQINDDRWRNNRFSEVFKNADGQAYWSQGKVFSDDGGESWYTSSESRVHIEFPFTVPNKPEYVILDSMKGENHD